MKIKYAVLVSSLLLTLILNAKVDFIRNIGVEYFYKNNVLSLSDEAIKEFESGTSVDKFKIKSSDDLVLSGNVLLGIKYNFIKHTQIIKASFKIDDHQNNNVLDKYSLGVELKQYFNRYLNLTIGYNYHPEIYVNRYLSVTDRDPVYRDFTYGKNSIDLTLFWQPLRYLSGEYSMNYSQLYYNKYFTEYDADNLKNELGFTLKPFSDIRLKLGYAYLISSADGKEAYGDVLLLPYYKDASYQADRFSTSISLPAPVAPRNLIRLYLSFATEKRYFHSEERLDEYHWLRVDSRNSFSTYLIVNPVKYLTIKLFYSQDNRDADSPFSVVRKDKSNKEFQSGMSMAIDF